VRLFFLMFILAAQAPGLERLNPPAYLAGNPGLYVDFNFSAGPPGRTRVEFDLGGRFSDLKLPSGAARPPKLNVRFDVEPRYPIKQEPLARGGTVDLAQVLREKGLSFTARAFGKGASLSYQAAVQVDLAPAEYLVTVGAEDAELGLKNSKTLRVTVPSAKAEDWSLGDLRFHSGRADPFPADANPFRQVGKKAGFPLAMSYEVGLPSPDWAGNTALVHRYAITRLEKKQTLVWNADQARPLGVEGSKEEFSLPGETWAKFKKGRYLLFVQVMTPDGKASRRHAFKSFEVVK
jgi:hypothetical protein